MDNAYKNQYVNEFCLTCWYHWNDKDYCLHYKTDITKYNAACMFYKVKNYGHLERRNGIYYEEQKPEIKDGQIVEKLVRVDNLIEFLKKYERKV